MRHATTRFLFFGVLIAALGFAFTGNASPLVATVWADEEYSVYASTSEIVDGTLFLEGSGGVEDPLSAEIELVPDVTNLHPCSG